MVWVSRWVLVLRLDCLWFTAQADLGTVALTVCVFGERHTSYMHFSLKVCPCLFAQLIDACGFGDKVRLGSFPASNTLWETLCAASTAKELGTALPTQS